MRRLVLLVIAAMALLAASSASACLSYYSGAQEGTCPVAGSPADPYTPQHCWAGTKNLGTAYNINQVQATIQPQEAGLMECDVYHSAASAWVMIGNGSDLFANQDASYIQAGYMQSCAGPQMIDTYVEWHIKGESINHRILGWAWNYNGGGPDTFQITRFGSGSGTVANVAVDGVQTWSVAVPYLQGSGSNGTFRAAQVESSYNNAAVQHCTVTQYRFSNLPSSMSPGNAPYLFPADMFADVSMSYVLNYPYTQPAVFIAGTKWNY